MPTPDCFYSSHVLYLAAYSLKPDKLLGRKDFDDNELLRLSLTHLLQIIGEAARRVSPELRKSHSQIDWKAIVGMRSKVVHDYLNVDEDIVWDTVTNELPSLVKQLERILDSENSE
jgi:uncharacterized protein with HEPN domain